MSRKRRTPSDSLPLWESSEDREEETTSTPEPEAPEPLPTMGASPEALPLVSRRNEATWSEVTARLGHRFGPMILRVMREGTAMETEDPIFPVRFGYYVPFAFCRDHADVVTEALQAVTEQDFIYQGRYRPEGTNE